MRTSVATVVFGQYHRFVKRLSRRHKHRARAHYSISLPYRGRSEGRNEDNRPHPFGASRDEAQSRPIEAGRSRRSALSHVARIASVDVLEASIVHEVNQPLASIVTNGQTTLRCLDGSAPDIEKVRELIERVVADAWRASEIIGRLRAMAARQLTPKTSLSLADLINESLVLLRNEFQSKDISVSLDLAPDLPLIFGDRTQLQQVIVNLAVNAAQAMADSEDSHRSIFIRATRADPETVSCVVEDSGPGIEPAHLPYLFDNFFTTKDTGMGMGLPICRSIMEAHDGLIRADNWSALGGARFTLSLPAARAQS
jgi:C4-dicarboxylate-specific signal transduction histidine kinase